MKHLVFLALCVISICAIEPLFQQNPSCRDIKYVGQGEKCISGENSKLTCKQFLQCVEGTCKPGHIGAFCSQHSDCYLSSPNEEGIKCINSKCTKKRYNGFSCSMNDECHSTMCTNGKCTGYKIGETCQPEQPVQCDRGLYCSWNGAVCVEQKKYGERCDDYEPREVRSIPEGSNYMVICQGGSQCIKKVNATRATCEQVYVSRAGQPCIQTENCYPGFSCRGGSCVERTFGDTPCAGGRNCTSLQNERCICIDGEAPTCKKTGNVGCGFNQALQDWTDCWRRFNCNWERNIFTAMLTEMFQKETCMGMNCGHIPRAALCCRNSGFDGVVYSTASLGPLQCTSGSAITAVIVILGLIILASLAVSGAILGVWLYKRRRTESFERLPD